MMFCMALIFSDIILAESMLLRSNMNLTLTPASTIRARDTVTVSIMPILFLKVRLNRLLRFLLITSSGSSISSTAA